MSVWGWGYAIYQDSYMRVGYVIRITVDDCSYGGIATIGNGLWDQAMMAV